MKLKELFQDISETFYELLYEMAFSRRDAESRITGLSHSIIKHLIKVLKWDDQINNYKHLEDIDSWLIQVKIVKLKGNKIPKVNDYYAWMFSDLVNESTPIELWISSLNKYHSLKVVRTDKEVYLKLIEIMTKISEDLGKNKLQNIDFYLE